MKDIYKPAAYDKDILNAARALFDGKANEGQQKRFLEWLLFNACHIGKSSMQDNPVDMAWLEGQRSIALQINWLRDPGALALIEQARIKRTKRVRGNREANDGQS